jgi:hypothetical protein
MQCSNHLKQYGVSLHNFVAAKDGFLPWIVLHESRPSFFATLMPFYEQTALYDQFMANGQERALQDLTSWDTATNSFTGTSANERYRKWWEGLDAAKQNEYSSIPTWKCPSRRSGVQKSTDFDTATADNYMPTGPVSDYACVVYLDDPGTAWVAHVTCTNDGQVKQQRGPLRVGRQPKGIGVTNVDAVTPRDRIGYWSDGSSNQIVVGEKHVPQGTANICRTPWYKQGECTALTLNARAVAGGSRRVYQTHRLATGPNDFVPPDMNSTDNQADYSPYMGYGFGSYHSGVCQFLMGDGAVKSISTTTPMDKILVPLADVSDGVSVSLP